MAFEDRIYRLLVEAVTDYAIFMLDPTGRVVNWNSGARRIKGYEDAEIIGQHFSRFYTEEDRASGLPQRALAQAAGTGRFEAEGWRVRKDGTRFWASVVIDAIRGDDGALIGFAKVTRDLTERRAAEQALLESERRFRLLVQGVIDYAIFMLDPTGRVVNWNSGARRIKGYEDAEIIGQHFSRFYTEEDRASGLPQRALAQAAGTGRFEAEGWRVRKDGTRFWASVVIDAIRGDDGALIGFAKVTRDVTERVETQRALQEAREQLLQAQKLEALGQLTGGIAHDFNNLLQVMSGGIALAAKLAAGNDRLGRILEEMRNAVSRGSAVTRQLLAFSRRAPIRQEVLDTAQTMRNTVDLFSHSLRADIRVELSLAEDLWPLRADATQLELALLNIAVNARDAMPSGGTLHVSAENVTLEGKPDGLAGRFIRIGLRDTGAGIPQEVLSRVFEPFFTTKPVGKGTGLGLSQVHGFARQTGGTVTVSSRVNEGTEVVLLLPAALPGECSDGQEAAGEEARAAATGLRILVVDDDAAVGRLTAGMLASAGHFPVSTTDPRAALERLGKDEAFDVVLSDVIMPGGMGGVEFARQVRLRWPDLPLLLASGYTVEVDVIQREFPVLQKPFTTLELIRAIEALVLAKLRGRHGAGARPGRRPPHPTRR